LIIAKTYYFAVDIMHDAAAYCAINRVQRPVQFVHLVL